jgi:Mtf2 family
MTAARKHALRRAWRAIAAPPPQQFPLPTFCQIRTIGNAKNRKWQPRSQRSEAAWTSRTDNIPFVNIEPNWEDADRTESPASSTTMTKGERAAFARLFDIVGSGPTLIRPQSNVTLVEGRRKPQEREHEVVSLLEQAILHTREHDRHAGKNEESMPSSEHGHEDAHLPTSKHDDATASLEHDSRPLLSEQAGGGAGENQMTTVQTEGVVWNDSGVEQSSDISGKIERFPEPLREMAAAANERLQMRKEWENLSDQLQTESLTPDVTLNEKGDPMAAARKEQHTRIATQLQAAATDWEIWRVLRSEVFSIIARLELDGPVAKLQTSEKVVVPKAKKLSKKKAKESELVVDIPKPQEPFSQDQKMTQLAIIGPNYPSLLLIAMQQLRERFPGSTLPFSILPTIQSFGRSSYVLGASTGLYNELISAYYTMYLDLDNINTLLIEMENAGLEFDQQTFKIVDGIRYHGNAIMRASKQREKERVFWSTDVVQNGWRRVIGWVPIIRKRLQAAVARRAEEARDLQEVRVV